MNLGYSIIKGQLYETIRHNDIIVTRKVNTNYRQQKLAQMLIDEC